MGGTFYICDHFPAAASAEQIGREMAKNVCYGGIILPVLVVVTHPRQFLADNRIKHL